MASATVASNTIVLEALNQHNYKDWSSRLETYLLSKDLWDIVKAEPPEVENGEDEYKAWRTKNAKALHAIKISCGTEMFSFIREVSTAKIAWEVLKKKFETQLTVFFEKKGTEISRSLHTANNAGQTREVGKELVLADEEELEIKASENGNENDEFNSSYGPFFKYVKKGDWDNAKECLPTLHPNAIRAKEPGTGYTALHWAVSLGHVHIVKELVSLMREEDFEIKDNGGDTALHKAVNKENVDIVKQLVPLMRPESLGIQDNEGQTALHMATWLGHANIVKELVSLMREEDFEIKDCFGETALHNAVEKVNVDMVNQLVTLMRPEGLEIKDHFGYIALRGTLMGTLIGTTVAQSEGDVQIARCMVEKNQNILNIGIPPDNHIAVVMACGGSNWEMFRYIYSATPLEALLPENGTQGAKLISNCIRLGKGLDIALDLLRRCSRLAVVDNGFGSPPMLELACMRYAFLSGKQLTFLQKWIYNPEISINVSKSEDDQGKKRDPICSVMSLYRRFVKGRLVKLLGIDHMYEMKSTHIRVYDILRCMGEEIEDLSTFTLAEVNVVTSSIFKAVEQGHVEFLIQLVKVEPRVVDLLDTKERSIFHFAMECRQEGIYNLIYGLEKEKRNMIGRHVAKFNNTMLHSAANLSPLTRIQGASLQMQRELQWFKEVESIVPVEMHEYLNFSDGLTARELFTKNHKKLMEQAEISMKATATSCTTVGALIITIMFSVAFTIPGGTNDSTGLPMFMHKKLFRVFIVSDTISLASSSTSVITFLGILTSRYAEVDFLKSLPTKMMVGLFTLFISIAAMMIAFSCALTIMLDGEACIIIPSILFASVPAISFIWFLAPLLVEIFTSTYGRGIFDRNVKPWLA